VSENKPPRSLKYVDCYIYYDAVEPLWYSTIIITIVNRENVWIIAMLICGVKKMGQPRKKNSKNGDGETW
jgi:hypothetical protein